MTFNVLVVEDEPLLALDLSSALEDAGFHVVGVASDTNSALVCAQDGNIDLATMDVRLAGGADGVETALLLRRNFDIPSLFVTSLPRSALTGAEAAEPVGYLQKPADMAEVARRIRRHLRAC